MNMGIIKVNIMDRPDYWCIMGWSNTLKKMGYDADNVFFGNSITYDSSFGTYFKDKKVVTLGYPGDRIEGMLLRYKQIISVKPEKVFVMAGINDLTVGMTIQKFKENYNVLIDSITSALPFADIYLESLLPVNHTMNKELVSHQKICMANRIIRDVCQNKGLTYVDLYQLYADEAGEMPVNLTRDGIHPYSSSYKRWASAIIPFIYDDNSTYKENN